MRKIKILIITSGLTAGGVDTLILNTLSLMDRDKFQIDFLIFEDSKDDWAERYKEYGCNILKIPRTKENGIVKAVNLYRSIFRSGKYDIIHSHIGFGSTIPVIARLGLKNVAIITHAHFDNYEGSTLSHAIGHLIFNVLPCKKLACSNGASIALYGKRANYTFVKNGIDTERFGYKENIREEVRKEFGISKDEFVVGTVGRMQYQKNHDFLIDIFIEILKKHPSSKMILVGDGELRPEIEKKIEKNEIQNKVIFTGIRTDVHRLLQGMDTFIMPTRFEGLSLALLEVQCSGLPCLTTDVVPSEAKVTKCFEFHSLKDSAVVWADEALKYLNYNRMDGTMQIKNANFDKESSAKNWFDIYKTTVKRG